MKISYFSGKKILLLILAIFAHLLFAQPVYAQFQAGLPRSQQNKTNSAPAPANRPSSNNRTTPSYSNHTTSYSATPRQTATPPQQSGHRYALVEKCDPHQTGKPIYIIQGWTNDYDYNSDKIPQSAKGPQITTVLAFKEPQHFAAGGKPVDNGYFSQLGWKNIRTAERNHDLDNRYYIYSENEKPERGGIFFFEGTKESDYGNYDYASDSIKINLVAVAKKVGIVRYDFGETGFLNKDIKDVTDMEIFKVIIADASNHERTHQLYVDKNKDFLAKGNLSSLLDRIGTSKISYRDEIIHGRKPDSIDITYALIESERVAFLNEIIHSQEPKHVIYLLNERYWQRDSLDYYYIAANSIVRDIGNNLGLLDYRVKTLTKAWNERNKRQGRKLYDEQEVKKELLEECDKVIGPIADNFFASLSNEIIKNEARKVFEKDYGAVPTFKTIIPEAVFEWYKTSKQTAER
jgi:hypothetical protein